jgi:hypothetical protein
MDHQWVATGVIKPIANVVCFEKQNQDLFFWFRKPGILDHESLPIELFGEGWGPRDTCSCDC